MFIILIDFNFFFFFFFSFFLLVNGHGLVGLQEEWVTLVIDIVKCLHLVGIKGKRKAPDHGVVLVINSDPQVS